MSAVPGTQSGTAHFEWVTQPRYGVTLAAVAAPTRNYDHDPDVHTQNEADERRFCAPLAVVTNFSADDEGATVSWAPVPYCQRRRTGFQTIGWNLGVSVGDGSQVIITTRHAALSGGGKWHLSANESATPTDFQSNQVDLQHVDLAAVAARALVEELGVPVSADEVQSVTLPVGLFQVGNNLGFFLHVQGERLGWTESSILAAHETAADGWEGVPRAVSLSRAGLLGAGCAEEWTAWGLPCLLTLADVSTR